jgi:general secretion pathway protein E
VNAPTPARALVDIELLRLARARGQAPIEVLASAHGVSEREAAALLASRFAMPYLGSEPLMRLEPAFDRWSLARAQQRNAVLVPPQIEAPTPSDAFLCIIVDPFDTDLLTQIEHAVAAPVTFAIAAPSDLHAYLNRQEARARAVDELPGGNDSDAEGAAALQILSIATVSEASSPAVKLVSSTLYDALRSGASDVHLESTPAGMSVKYRIDGTLDSVTQAQGVTLAEQVISRLKVLAELDIAERRVPQDGSFRVLAQGRPIDLRVSIMPSVHGEDAVVRILDKQAMIEAHGRLTLDALGFDEHSLRVLRTLIEAPHGMLLVTGPTGSGKTTTLYAALSETQTGRDKIITIEDPVEYQLPGILQIPVNEKKGLTFARGLRSILRHDPDKIMVGEVRDRDTAEISVQSALTGHLVLTTVHANSVFDVFGRFAHMGLDPYALVSALNGIWAQRLLRINCPNCSRPYEVSEEELSAHGFAPGEPQAAIFRKGMGCGDCRGTGFRGRRAIAEVLRLDDELRELIVDKQPLRRIKEAARRKGTRSLAEAALAVACAGETTLEEVRRVTLSD